MFIYKLYAKRCLYKNYTLKDACVKIIR